jgi:uncharacterized membrane protein YeaQ/YmgE (transglycosylase-associated protein family)
MSVMAWIILGGIAGWLASLLMGEKQGCLTDIIVGILGALLGGFLFSVSGHQPLTGFSMWSFFIALIGSALLIAFFRALRGPTV